MFFKVAHTAREVFCSGPWGVCAAFRPKKGVENLRLQCVGFSPHKRFVEVCSGPVG